MHLVNEEDVASTQIGQDGSQIARPFNRGTRRNFNVDTHLRREDVREGGFSQAGRSVEKNMFKCLASLPGRLDLNP